MITQNQITETPAFVSETADVYLSTSNIAKYFSTRFHTEFWDNASEDDRRKAAAVATRMIDMLKYKGRKTDPNQSHEFPRIIERGTITTCVTETQTDVPENVQAAFCEIVGALLTGVDVDKEADSLFVTSDGISSIRTHFDTKTVPDWTKAGIPSKTAWNLLLPYLIDDQSLQLIRVN